MSATPKFPHCWVEGDRLPIMTCTLVDKNLTGYTVTLHLRRADGTILTKAATAIDLTQGHFSFDWADGDLVAGYNQEAEVQFVDGDDKSLTSKLFLVDVRPEIA